MQGVLNVKIWSNRTKKENERDNWLSLARQHAGKGKWKQEIKKLEEFIHNSSWKGLIIYYVS